jgi:hypothetical protein
MAQRESEIRENPKYSQKKVKNEDSKLSTPNEFTSKYGDNADYRADDSNNNTSAVEDLNNSLLDSSANVSQLNKTARVQHHMSILQRNFAKISPIFREMISLLVKEGGDTSFDESLESNFEINDVLVGITDEQKAKVDMRNMLGFLNQNLYHDYLNITNIMKLKRLDFRDVYGFRNPDLILTRENLMERVMLLITAYF